MKNWLTAILQSVTCSKVRIALFLGLVSSSVFSLVTTDQLQIETSPPQYIFFRTPSKNSVKDLPDALDISATVVLITVLSLVCDVVLPLTSISKTSLNQFYL